MKKLVVVLLILIIEIASVRVFLMGGAVANN